MRLISKEEHRAIQQAAEETADHRGAIVDGKALDLTMYDAHHIVTVYDVSDTHYYNLSTAFNYSDDELVGIYDFGTDALAATLFWISLIQTQALQLVR